jgi:hypothetical protein
VEDIGFEEGPGADTAAFNRWMWKKDEHALISSNHGKEVPKAPEG